MRKEDREQVKKQVKKILAKPETARDKEETDYTIRKRFITRDEED